MIKIHKIRDSQGAALLTVVLIFLVLLVMLSGVMAISVSNQRSSLKVNSHTSAYYAAESALNYNLARAENYFLQVVLANQDWAVMSDLMKDYFVTIGGTMSMNDNMGKSVESHTVISEPYTKLSHPDYLFVKFITTGIVGDMQRTVETEVGYYYKQGLQGNQQIGKALIAKGNVYVCSSCYVEGKVGSNLELSDADRITFDWNTGTGGTANNNLLSGVYVPGRPVSKIVANAAFNIHLKTYDNDVYIFPDYELPNYPSLASLTTVNLTNNTVSLPPLTEGKVGAYISSLSNLSGTVTVDLGAWVDSNPDNKDNVKILRVGGSFTTSNGTLINVVGNGRLLILFDYTSGTTGTNSLAFGNNTRIYSSSHPNDSEKILMTLKTKRDSNGSQVVSTFSPGNGAVLNINILADRVKINSSNSEINGHIITRYESTSASDYGIDLNANSSVDALLIYAPYSNIRFTSSFLIKGAVVGRTLSLTSGARIKYMDIDGSDFPFDIDLPYTETGGASPAEYSIVIGPSREN